MNWGTIGAIGEALGAIAVVASLLYLAKQIRNGNTWDRTSTFREIMGGLLREETMENWAWYLKTRLFPYPGVREWWTHFESGYAPGFQNWVGTIIEQTDPSDDPYGLMGNESASGYTNNA